MEVKILKIEDVHPSPMNPRKTFDDGEIAELAQNISQQGLLQPITVRPIYSDYLDNATGEVVTVIDGYEIICGERRYRAVSLLAESGDEKWSTITAIVRDMTDEEAFDAMITENLQRKDVDPIEEAFAFVKLQESGKTIYEIAVRFGKSIRFVQDRCKLNNLIPELMGAVKVGQLPISAAMVLSKLDKEYQRKYFDFYGESERLSKDTADSFVNSLFMNLESVGWQDTFTGGCGRKCEECQNNTANHGCLFWEMKSKGAGRCTDRKMFAKKQTAYLLDEIKNQNEDLVRLGAPLEKDKVVIINIDEWCAQSTKDLKADVYEAIRNAGYEVTQADGIFSYQCHYEDERLERLIANGNVYPCLRLFQYDRVKVVKGYWYFKGREEHPSDPCAENNNVDVPQKDAMSVEVMTLMQKKARLRELLREKLTEKERNLATSLKAADRMGELSDKEMFAFDIILFTLLGREYLKKYNITSFGKPYELKHLDAIRQNRADRNQWIREIIRNILESPNIVTNELYQRCADLVLPEWLPNEMDEHITKANEKFSKQVAKIDARLEELGYDAEGKLR